MARALQFIANITGPQDSIPLDSIPQEVKDEVEQVYENLKTHPGGRIRATFDNRAELLQYVAQATSYCNQRPGGAIRFRRSPTKNLTDNIMDFRISDLPPDNGTEDIREAAKIANTPAPAAAPAAAPARARSRK